MLMCQTSFGDGCRTLLQLSRQVALAQCCPRLCEVTADMTANSLRQLYSLPSVRWISCIWGCPHQVTKTYLPSRKGWRKGLMWYFSHQDSPLTTPDSIFNANEHKSRGWKEGRKGQQAISESRPTTEKQLVFRLPRCSAFAWTRDFMMLLPPTSCGDWEINTPFTETTKVKVVWTGANCRQARTKASQIWLSLHYS